jgi:hypothetical protein
MFKRLLTVLFFVLFSSEIFAQCAMCKSVVESNMDGGSLIGSGLNDGILYLMVMPYIALMIIAFVWRRHKKANKGTTV